LKVASEKRLMLGQSIKRHSQIFSYEYEETSKPPDSLGAYPSELKGEESEGEYEGTVDKQRGGRAKEGSRYREKSKFRALEIAEKLEAHGKQ